MSGMTLTMFMSFANVKRFNGAPWRLIRDVLAKAVPSMAAMPLDLFQRKVFLTAICMPMLGIHAADAIVAGYVARRRSHRLWMTYSLRTLILGFGQLRHLLPEAGGAYGAFTVAAFCASALAASKVR